MIHLALAALTIVPALPLGAAALRLLGLESKDFAGWIERWLVAGTAGLGLLALALTLLGLAQALYTPVVLGLPIVAGLAGMAFGWPLLAPMPPALPPQPDGAGTEPAGSAGAVVKRLALVRGQPRGAWAVMEWLALGATLAGLAVLAVAVLVQDLAPPTDYDGLLYHLVIPREFLRAHAMVYIPQNFSANLPALGEMLYTIGLAGGSDRAPQLVHGAAGALVVALTYVLGARSFGRVTGRWAAAGLAATPLVPFLSTRAYIDLFTVLFGLPAVFAVLLWLETRRTGWLTLAGLSTGLALDTKYAALPLALALLAVLGLAAFIERWHRASGPLPARLASRLELAARRPAPPGSAALRAAVLVGAGTAAAALPWYAREWIVLGNPVWPMVFGGRDWDPARVAQLTYFVSQYGAGHTLRDWVLLPWNVYTQSWRFGHVPSSYPPLLALAAPLALVMRGAAAPRLRWLLAVAILFALLWARGYQDLRFLAGIYPLLALAGAAGLAATVGRWPAGRALVGAGIAALVWAAALPQARLARDALPVVIGQEAIDHYLARRLPDYHAIQLLNAQVASEHAVLFLGDGQIWYCRPRCLPDAAHDNLLLWFVRPGSPEASLALLQRAGVSHILLSKRDYWYLEHQDPQDRLKQQLAQFYLFKARYLELIYADDLTEVYRGRW